MNNDGNNNHPLKILINKYGFKGTVKILFSDVLFDYIKGVDTFLPVSREKLFSGKRLELQNRYVPSTFDLVKKTIQRIEPSIEIEKSNFIDYGSGKGKVLIGASKFQFKKIKGIEFSNVLHEIAVNNINKLKLQSRVDLYNADATEFPLDKDDTVLYFFNPFMGELLENCLKNILKYKSEKKRYFIVANPIEDAVFCKYLTKISEETIHPGNIRVNFYHD